MSSEVSSVVKFGRCPNGHMAQLLSLQEIRKVPCGELFREKLQCTYCWHKWWSQDGEPRQASLEGDFSG